MFSNPILADILRQIPNPKVTSLSNHLAPNSSWGTLYVASIDKITYAHIIIPVETARHITPLLQHTTLQRVTSPWRDQNQNLPRLADRTATLPKWNTQTQERVGASVGWVHFTWIQVEGWWVIMRGSERVEANVQPLLTDKNLKRFQVDGLGRRSQRGWCCVFFPFPTDVCRVLKDITSAANPMLNMSKKLLRSTISCAD